MPSLSVPYLRTFLLVFMRVNRLAVSSFDILVDLKVNIVSGL